MCKEYLLESSPMVYWWRNCNESHSRKHTESIKTFTMRNIPKVKLSVDEVQTNVLFSHIVTPCIHLTFTILFPSFLKKALQGRRVHAQSAELRHWIRQLTTEFRILDKCHLKIRKTWVRYVSQSSMDHYCVRAFTFWKNCTWPVTLLYLFTYSVYLFTVKLFEIWSSHSDDYEHNDA